MRRLLSMIDAISGYMGGLMKWFCYILVLVVVTDVVLRYVFNAAPVWAYDISVMLGGTIYVLAWSYTHRYDGHVRVDIFYARMSPRKKAILDVVGTFIFVFPLMAILIKESWEWAWRAWVINERFMETYFYPPVAPFRTIVLIGFCLLLLQSIAIFTRDLYFVVRNKPYA